MSRSPGDDKCRRLGCVCKYAKLDSRLEMPNARLQLHTELVRDSQLRLRDVAAAVGAIDGMDVPVLLAEQLTACSDLRMLEDRGQRDATSRSHRGRLA